MELASRHDDPGERLTTVAMGMQTTRAASGMTSQGGASGRDLEQAISTLRARIDEEFRIAERLDTKGRQAFALAAAFFAVVQTVAFGSFAASGVHPGERVLLGIAAVIAGLSLVVVAHRLTHGEELQEEEDVAPEAIVEWCNEADEPEYVSVRLVAELSGVARSRTDNNKTRARKYDAIADATRLALILAGVQLVLAIIVRV